MIVIFLCSPIGSMNRGERRCLSLEEDGVIKILLEVKSDVSRIEGKLDSYNGLREKVDTIEDRGIESEQRSKSNTHRIDKIEGNLTWLWRTVVGAIIVAAIGALAIFK